MSSAARSRSGEDTGFELEFIFSIVEEKMKQSDRISYEKPELSKYGFFGVANGDASGGLSQGGDISEACDSDFDE